MGEAESVCLSVCSVYCLSRIYCTIIGVLTVLFAGFRDLPYLREVRRGPAGARFTQQIIQFCFVPCNSVLFYCDSTA